MCDVIVVPSSIALGGHGGRVVSFWFTIGGAGKDAAFLFVLGWCGGGPSSFCFVLRGSGCTVVFSLYVLGVSVDTVLASCIVLSGSGGGASIPFCCSL